MLRANIKLFNIVPLLGVLLTSNLSTLDKHVTSVVAKCFLQLRQLCRIQCSLADECRHTGSCTRCCPCQLLYRFTGWLTKEDDQAAKGSQCSYVSCIKLRQFDGGLTHFWRHILRWLDVTDRCTSVVTAWLPDT